MWHARHFYTGQTAASIKMFCCCSLMDLCYNFQLYENIIMQLYPLKCWQVVENRSQVSPKGKDSVLIPVGPNRPWFSVYIQTHREPVFSRFLPASVPSSPASVPSLPVCLPCVFKVLSTDVSRVARWADFARWAPKRLILMGSIWRRWLMSGRRPLTGAESSVAADPPAHGGTN